MSLLATGTGNYLLQEPEPLGTGINSEHSLGTGTSSEHSIGTETSSEQSAAMVSKVKHKGFVRENQRNIGTHSKNFP
jgi:hypothetical protein